MTKKMFVVLISSILILFVTACTGTSEVPVEDQPQSTAETADIASQEGQDNQDADTGTDAEADQGGDAEAVTIDAAAIFSARCSSCHGTDRQGANGPPLLPGNLTKDASVYLNTITNGSGPMPSWEGRLSADEINAMVEFILSEVE